MKIRTDFVTNSSSSSFSLLLTVRGMDGSEVSYEDHPYEEDSGEAELKGVLRALSVPFSPSLLQELKDRTFRVVPENPAQEKRLKAVKDGEELDLVKDGPSTAYRNGEWVEMYSVGIKQSTGLIGWIKEDVDDLIPLMSVGSVVVKAVACKDPTTGDRIFRISVSQRDTGLQAEAVKDVAELANLLMSSVANDYNRPNKKKKQSFANELKKKIGSSDRIERITVTREYHAWGEFADLLPENDGPLRKLAVRVIESDGESRVQALQEMRAYVQTPRSDRAMNFGAGFEDVRYLADTDDQSLLRLAKHLCSHYGPNFVEGYEYSEINFVTGAYDAHADFSLYPYINDRGMDLISEAELRKQMEREREEEKRAAEIWERQRKEEWLKANGEILTPDPVVIIPEHIFVFEIDDLEIKYKELVTDRGGIVRTTVSGKTNYVVVDASGTYLGKPSRDALEQQKKGKNVQIILPEDLEKAFNG